LKSSVYADTHTRIIVRNGIFADTFHAACSGYTISSVSSRRKIQKKKQTYTQTGRHAVTLAHTATFPLLGS